MKGTEKILSLQSCLISQKCVNDPLILDHKKQIFPIDIDSIVCVPLKILHIFGQNIGEY